MPARSRSLPFLFPLALLAPAAAQTDWTALSTANAPTARFGHAMAYDSARDQVVLFGGSDAASGIIGETWIFDGSDWQRATPLNEPPPRVAHEMVYDAVRDRIVLFGGLAAGVLYSDTWEWDGRDWTQAFPTNSPSPRRSQPMAFDPIGRRVLLWGGFDGGVDVADTWAWDGQDWTAIPTANAPPARRASAMAADLLGGGILLFSGFQSPGDTWRFNGVDWLQLTPVTSPPARFDHMMAFDQTRLRVVLFGGPGRNDTWEWGGIDWVERMPMTQPSARDDGFLVFDTARSRVVLFGGNPRTSDTWAYAPVDPASYEVFGSGCAGGGIGPLQLTASGLPWTGESITLNVTGFGTGAAVAMLTGFSNTTWAGSNLPFDLSNLGATGCALRIEPFVAFPAAVAGTSATLPLSFGTDPGLLGFAFYNQAVTVRAGVNPLGVLTSNGGAGVIGGK